jgi:hypothetical protein
VRIITNMGAANPVAAARVVAEVGPPEGNRESEGRGGHR